MTNIFKPILFSTEMVQAILAGRKTQTRRIVNRQPDPTLKLTAKLSNQWDGKQDYPLTLVFYNEGTSKKSIYAEYSLPLCEPGDILWVRETWFSTQFNCKDLLECGVTGHLRFKADNNYDPRKDCVGRSWYPSIHMPKEAARIFLKVTNVRCERLQDISVWAAEKEGIERRLSDGSEEFKDYLAKGKNTAKFGSWGETYFSSPINSFESLWDSINAKKYPWESNPWVWVYDFERIENLKTLYNETHQRPNYQPSGRHQRNKTGLSTQPRKLAQLQLLRSSFRCQERWTHLLPKMQQH